ncbi:MAG TPA: TetR/AcrR family transcriptional regulator [Longimicrobiaceae bacterium]|nr:TetR/AcrR family transcriptional regulator [Longimicrobiaceae bacterium]
MPGRRAAEEERKRQIIEAAHRVAARRGLERLTIREVAAAAGLSTGLVHFHFKRRDLLLIALLDWVLETTTVLQVDERIEAIPEPLDRLLALLRQEMDRLTRDRRRIHVFFDFWLLGTRDAQVRRRMRAELKRYREAFRPMAEAVLTAEPERFRGVTAEGLASVVVGFIKGCAVQSVIDPTNFDVTQFLVAANALLAQLEETHT